MTDPVSILTVDNRAALTADLLAWYAAVKRDLPWREPGNLYGIWISEVMLQQTTVQAVIPFWERFMERFPTVQDLAGATESDVLEMWSGLGYYSRARNLHAAARIVTDDWGGVLPPTRDQWMTLPGVGPYAAGAIASIGLLEKVPAVDANARRVLQRWAVNDPGRFAALAAVLQKKLVEDLGADLVPDENPGDWNQAVMELGALVCGARRAECHRCPVREHCGAWLGEWVAEIPPPKKATVAVPVWVGQLLVTWRDRVLLVPPASSPVPMATGERVVARADFGRLHQGLWGLPMTPWLDGHQEPQWTSDMWRSWLSLPRSLWPPGTDFELAGYFRHGITKYRMRVAVFHLGLDPRLELPAEHLGSGTDLNRFSKALPGLFFPARGVRPPVSKLTDKGLHSQQNTDV